MRRTLAALVAAGLLVLVSGCGGSDAAASFHGNKLDPPFQASSDSLTDTDGQPYSLAETPDKPLTLVFFGYTHCPDICQAVMSSLASAMTRLDTDDRERVDVVFVTTDPQRDTQSVLKTYLQHFDPGFIGLTGDIDTIIAVGKPLAVGIEQGQKLPSGGYDVTHGTTITGIEDHGVAPVYWDQDTSSAEFASDIHTLLNEE